MSLNDLRYQVRLKQAVLETHAAALYSIAQDIEYRSDEPFSFQVDDYRLNEEAMTTA